MLASPKEVDSCDIPTMKRLSGLAKFYGCLVKSLSLLLEEVAAFVSEFVYSGFVTHLLGMSAPTFSPRCLAWAISSVNIVRELSRLLTSLLPVQFGFVYSKVSSIRSSKWL